MNALIITGTRARGYAKANEEEVSRRRAPGRASCFLLALYLKRMPGSDLFTFCLMELKSFANLSQRHDLFFDLN